MSRLTVIHPGLFATLGLCAATILLSAPVSARTNGASDQPDPTAIESRGAGQRGVAETAPTSGGYATSGGTTNAFGNNKSNRAGIPGNTQQQERLQISSADNKLMRELALAHLAEIKMAGLATAISGDTAVRGYAEKMLEEHITALDELKLLAERGGVILPGGVDKSIAPELRELGLKTGKEFDQMYMQRAALAGHEASHKLFQDALRRATSLELKAHLANYTPIVASHLQLAQQMQADPAQAAAMVRAAVRAGQSVSIRTPGGAASNQENSNSAARGASSLAGSGLGKGKGGN